MPLPLLYKLVFDEKWDSVLERVEAYPKEANEVGGAQGATPLYRASTIESSPLSVIKALLIANPTAAIQPDIGNITPLHELCESLENIFDGLTSTEKGNARSILEQNESHQLTKAWAKFSLLIEAAYFGSIASPLPGGRKWRILHTCVALDQFLVPPSTLKVVVKIYPEQLQEPNENGNLPLHLAAANPIVNQVEVPETDLAWDAYYSSMSGIMEFHFGPVKPHRNTIKFLVDTYPEAAAAPNRNNQLSLYVALDNDKIWDDTTKLIYMANPEAANSLPGELFQKLPNEIRELCSTQSKELGSAKKHETAPPLQSESTPSKKNKH